MESGAFRAPAKPKSSSTIDSNLEPDPQPLEESPTAQTFARGIPPPTAPAHRRASARSRTPYTCSPNSDVKISAAIAAAALPAPRAPKLRSEQTNQPSHRKGVSFQRRHTRLHHPNNQVNAARPPGGEVPIAAPPPEPTRLEDKQTERGQATKKHRPITFS